MFPCKVGSAWEVFAPAKLNLYLDVMGCRPDGFHELETLMVPVRIYDSLRWIQKPSPGLTLRIQNLLPPGSFANEGFATDEMAPRESVLVDADAKADNLVLRAGQLLAQSAGIQPCGTFELVKRIPIQAGMGGGSSDAAATLRLANAAWGIGYSTRQLVSLAAELGRDVPFFLQSSSAICRGRGELIESVTGLPHLHFVILKPAIGLSTAEVFSRFKGERRFGAKQETLPKLITLLRRGDIAQASSLMHNTLESVAAEMTPWIERLRKSFANCGCYTQLMTGSGSAFLGVMRSAAQAKSAAHLLASRGLGTVLTTSSL